MLPGSTVKDDKHYSFIRGDWNSEIKRSLKDVLADLDITPEFKPKENLIKIIHPDINGIEDSEEEAKMKPTDEIEEEILKMLEEFDGDVDLIETVIKGFEGLTIHNDAQPIEKEISFITMANTS